MQTKLIEGAAPRANDQQILAAAEGKAGHDGEGHAMVIGVRNEGGQLYRAFQTIGPEEFMALAAALKRLGLTDELAGENGMRERCDAIFR